MKRDFLILCIFINSLFPIGLKALIIPQTASLLSKSGAGISNSHDVNPALLYSTNSHVSFSKNNWFGDLEGQKIAVLLENRTLLSFETLSVTDIELRDEIASDSPIGFFGAYWYALELNRPINLKASISDHLSIGYKIKFNFSKLYTEKMQGYSFDIGLNNKINDNLSLGFVIKNIGEESSNNLRVDNLATIGLGISYFLLNNKLLLIADVINQNNENYSIYRIELMFKKKSYN